MRRVLSTLAGIFLAALLIAALAPKATRGVAALLVQVVNTASNPVSVEDVAPHEVFQANCSSGAEGFTSVGCSIAVPAGKRLVVQTGSIHIELDTGVHVLGSSFFASAGGDSATVVLNVPLKGFDGVHDLSEGSQEFRLYADSSVGCKALYDDPLAQSTIRCDVVGYLANVP